MFEDFVNFDPSGGENPETSVLMDDSGLNYAYDSNGDGTSDVFEAFSDFDDYGNPHSYTVNVDTDHNGTMDSATQVNMDDFGNVVAYTEMNDYNQDGQVDMYKTFVDTTGTGDFDTVATIHTDNTNSDQVFTMDLVQDFTGDHTPDQSMNIVGMDTDGDGKADVVRISERDADGNDIGTTEMSYEDWTHLGGLDYTTTFLGTEENSVGANFDPSTDTEDVSGDPAEEMQYWEYQGNTGRCALYAQKFVIESITGQDIPIEEFVQTAEENGWFNEAEGGGTVTLNMDKMLEYYGIDHEMSFDNSIDDLETALNDGDKVIVGVDSGQIWYGDSNDIFTPETAADHAVEVIGIDRSDPNNPMVVLNDSGTPDGCGELVPIDTFENAWKAGDSQMIVCEA